jgi:hypothetical protein
MILPSRISIILGALALCAACSIITYITGSSHGQNVILNRQADALQKYSLRTKKVTTEVITVYKDKIKTVYIKGDTIIKEVPVYVTQKDDSRCIVNNGFVSLWNASNKMSVPGAPSISDRTPSSVILSDIAAQHSRESLICHATEQKLLSLQDWLLKQSKIH